MSSLRRRRGHNQTLSSSAQESQAPKAKIGKMLAISYLDVSVMLMFLLGGGYVCADRCLWSFRRRHIRPKKTTFWTETPFGAAASIPAHVAWGLADFVQVNFEIIQMLPRILALGVTNLTLGACSIEECDSDDKDEDDEALGVARHDADADLLDAMDDSLFDGIAAEVEEEEEDGCDDDATEEALSPKLVPEADVWSDRAPAGAVSGAGAGTSNEAKNVGAGEAEQERIRRRRLPLMRARSEAAAKAAAATLGGGGGRA